MRTFVLDKNLKHLDFCHRARARELLKKGQARVFKRYPFTIVLQDRSIESSVTHPYRSKIDPGSKVTGIAVVQKQTGRLTNALEITHGGQQIKNALESRRALRRGRRNCKTRDRKLRFLNRTRMEEWLLPFLESRIANIETGVRRIRKVFPITAISQELVRFELQPIQNPEISRIEYQRGELCGFELKEYLLHNWGIKSFYCGAENIPLEIEHIIAKSKGGSNRFSNLTLPYHSCNQAKGNKPFDEFIKKKPDILKRVLVPAKASLKDAAVANVKRWELYRPLQAMGCIC